MGVMRIAELSERSGVPVPTIKYYLREGLLHRGELTSRNQARYGEAHLRRLSLVRALTDVGGLPVAAVREVLAHVDAPRSSTHNLLGRVLDAIPPAGQDGSPEEEDLARAQELVRDRGWNCHPDDPAVEGLAAVLAGYRRTGHPLGEEYLVRYAEAVEQVARVDLDTLRDTEELDEIIEGAVVGTVLGDALLAALRRLAQSRESALRAPGREN